jgi:hypothetical protein
MSGGLLRLLFPLMMEAVSAFEMSVSSYVITGRNVSGEKVIVIMITWSPVYIVIETDAPLKTETNSVALNQRTNYTDWATATCSWNLVPTFVDRRVLRGQRGGSLTVVILSFLNRMDR